MTSNSAPGTKRAWKLREFVGHGSSINCLALGRKSGHVMVTGGDDKKVNLWTVGNPSCIMSLSGHTSSIDSVRFSPNEEMVGAGSASGALKIWDLEASKLVRTFAGHKSTISCIDFHPYGDFLSSGSSDMSIKLWDIRRKGSIFTYKGHSQKVNSLKFSPDGQWIASAGEEGVVKIWDIRTAKLLTELGNHTGPVNDVEFHPHEFVLATGSQDKTINFWDLETFNVISTTERDTGPLRCLMFHPEISCMFSGSQDGLRVHSWEPAKMNDMVALNWGKIKDITISTNQLVGASVHMSNISIYVIDLQRVSPLKFVELPDDVAVQDQGGDFRIGQRVRRSFVKQRPDQMRKRSDAKGYDGASTDRSGTDLDDSSDSFSQADANEIFRPQGKELNRTPPMSPVEYSAPESSDYEMPSFTNINPRPTDIRLKPFKPSSSPARRQSQPTLHNSVVASPVRHRRGSNPPTPTPGVATLGRPMSVYDLSTISAMEARQGVGSNLVVDRGLFPDVLERISPTSGRSHSLNRPSSRVAESKYQLPGASTNERLLKKPTLVRPQRTSAGLMVSSAYNDASNLSGNDRSHSPPVSEARLARFASQNCISDSDMSFSSQPIRGFGNASSRKASQSITSSQDHLANGYPNPAEKLTIIPLDMEKPSGLPVKDFLPKKFQNLTLMDSNDSMYSSYCSTSDMSEAEVTSVILKGHESIMTVLANRGRQLEIIHKLWQSKDAKTAVDHSVSLNDPSVVVDLLSVIILRPSIWNLDLCVSLLPPIGELMQSKYESYISIGCNTMKLILKNFASVIKSNIDSPVQSVGVDISREERHNKCMQCYKDLVKIRSLILKRQTIQGKLGHIFRELAILMQYLD